LTGFFDDESPARREHEEIDRSGTEHGGQEARTEPADQRCDDNGRPECDELGTFKIRIERKPQRRGNAN
jgi:hypothetical protein